MTLKFREYIELEQLKKNLATERTEFPEQIFRFLSVANVSVKDNASWQETVVAFLEALRKTRPNEKLPLVKDSPKKEDKPSPWEYEGRGWFYWGNLFSKAYGWNLDYIANLDFNDALALAQEIMTDEQLEHEFAYSLSEIAYPYNRSTKKQTFKPMSRPYWMRPAFSEIKKVRVKRSLLPVGYGVDVSGLPPEYGIQNYLQAQ